MWLIAQEVPGPGTLALKGVLLLISSCIRPPRGKDGHLGGVGAAPGIEDACGPQPLLDGCPTTTPPRISLLFLGSYGSSSKGGQGVRNQRGSPLLHSS